MISDETIFGNVFFEPLAKLAAHGDVSPTEGVDFTVQRSERYLAVVVKSGPNWGNADQHKRQSTNFDALRKRLYKLNKRFDPLVWGKRKTENGKTGKTGKTGENGDRHRFLLAHFDRTLLIARRRKSLNLQSSILVRRNFSEGA